MDLRHSVTASKLAALMGAFAGCSANAVGPQEARATSTLTQGDAGADAGTRMSANALTSTASTGEAAVCTAWASIRDRDTRETVWTAGASQCAAGTLADATRTASTQWVNYYRQLAGLATVAEVASERADSQACAVMLERNGQLSHTPPASWACATADARETAARSNLSGNVGFPMSPWLAVRGWIDEGRELTNTLGHRRWLLSPELRTVTYGQTTSFACQVLGLGARDPHAPRFVAWPPPGWVPTSVVGTTWSVSMNGINAAGTTLTVRRDGVAVAVTPQPRASGYGDDTLSWEIPTLAAGSVYEVHVGVRGAASVDYEVRPTTCAHY